MRWYINTGDDRQTEGEEVAGGGGGVAEAVQGNNSESKDTYLIE